jgi:hypothetical protein
LIKGKRTGSGCSSGENPVKATVKHYFKAKMEVAVKGTFSNFSFDVNRDYAKKVN